LYENDRHSSLAAIRASSQRRSTRLAEMGMPRPPEGLRDHGGVLRHKGKMRNGERHPMRCNGAGSVKPGAYRSRRTRWALRQGITSTRPLRWVELSGPLMPATQSTAGGGPIKGQYICAPSRNTEAASTKREAEAK